MIMVQTSIVLSLIFLLSCKSTSIVDNNPHILESWVLNNLGNEVVTTKNSSGTFALCIKQNTAREGIAFYVIRVKDLFIVEKDMISPASIYWVDDLIIQIKFIPGIVNTADVEIPIKTIDLTKYIKEKL